MRKSFFQLSAKIAARSSMILTAIGVSILYFVTGHDFGQILLYSLLLFISSFAVIYLISDLIVKERVDQMYSMIEELSDQLPRLDQNVQSNPDIKDELGSLIELTQSAIQKVHKELKRLNKMENYRKEFIGDISHELKTPIFAIQGFVETLLNGAIHDQEVNEVFLKKTMRNVNRLIFLTNDLMEISKLETGELKSSIKMIYLRDIVLDVIESLQYQAQHDEIELQLKDFNKNLQVKADRNQIKQVLTNLIENGMKYNKPGGYVEIGIREINGRNDKIVIYVKDNGIGIDGDDINRVTERFFRVDKSRSREKGGTGLGLAIVKHIIEAHGEKLMIDSKPELGSEFSFTLTKAATVSV